MKDFWSKYFSKGDLLHLLEIVNRCPDCDSLSGFTDLLCNLQKIADFDSAVCTCVEPSLLDASIYETKYPINYQCREYPVDMNWFNQCYKFDVPLPAILSCLNFHESSKTVRRFGDGRLQIVVPQSTDNHLSDGWTFGTFENLCNRWILFIFAFRNTRCEPGRIIAVELAVPHLFRAFKGIRHLCRAKPFHLTKKEFEVLNWVKMGKTTWEISQILAVSESCVNFHMDNIRKKFDAVNRTQVVAVAVANGLIKI
jgi:LuxR family transcriptional regulator, quorum-sensing system regulator CviR